MRLSLFLLSFSFGWIVQAEPCDNACSRTIEKAMIPISSEWAQEETLCRDTDTGNLRSCPAVCDEVSSANHTPVDFIVSFLINPFFTSSFLAPQVCQTPHKKS